MVERGYLDLLLVAEKGFFQRVKKSCEIHILVNEQESF